MRAKFNPLLIFILLIYFSGILYAQEGNSKKTKYNNSTPYHAVVNHLKYLQDENFKPELAAMSINPKGLTQVKRIDLAKKLKQIFDGRGLYIQVNDIPKNPMYYDSLHDSHVFVVNDQLPAIYVEKSGTKWYYSEESVKEIDRLYNETFILGTGKLIEWMPEIGQKKYFGIKVWQYFGLLIIVTIAVILELIFEFIFKSVIRRILVKKGNEKIANQLILPVTRPFSLLLVFTISLLFIPILQLPIQIGKYLILTIKAFIPLLITIVIYKAVDLLSDYLMSQAEKTESTLDDQLIPLLRKILKVFIVIVGGMFVLLNLNVNIIPLLTGLSIGSLALALAAQDTLKNFFGSIMIFIDRPFQIGHWITSGDVDGTVEEVGFRSTRIRTFRNSLVYVPNGKIADSTIDNHGLRNYRRFYTKIGLMYDTPPEVIQVFVEGLRELVMKHPNTAKDRMEIHFNEMADFSLNIMFYIFFIVPTWTEELKARDEILIGIIRLAKELGVNFAFPTTTLHMETFPGKESLSPDYELDKSKLQEIKNKFIENYKA